MLLPAVTYQDEDGFWIGEIPTIPGLHSFGETKIDLLKNLQEALDLFLETYQNYNLPQAREYFLETLKYNVKTKNYYEPTDAQMARI